jgi:predicted dehydrogenase
MSKLAIIGAGNIVNAHLEAAMFVGFVPVAIVARENSKSVYKYSDQISGLRPCTNINELLNYEVDAFLIVLNGK